MIETGEIKEKLKTAVDKAEEKLEIADDGKLGMKDLLALMMKSSDADVNREAFLRKILEERFPPDVIEKAVETTPTEAGITVEELRDLLGTVIADGKKNVTAKQTVKDTVAGYEEGEKLLKKAKEMKDELTENRPLRESLLAIQKILYLYGFPQLNISEAGVPHGTAKLVMTAGIAVVLSVKDADPMLRAVAATLPELAKIPEDASLEKIMKSEELETTVKNWTKKLLGKKVLMTAAQSNALVGKVTRRGSFAAEFEKSCGKIAEVLTDTVLTNPGHQASEMEKKMEERIRKEAALLSVG